MKEETKTKLLNALRWIIFLPASAIGSWLLFVIFKWMNYTIPVFNADNLWNKLIELVAQLIEGGAFVAIGAYIVPNGRKIVAIILFAIMCVIVCFAFLFNLLGGFSWMYLLGEICTVIGSGYALYYVVNSDN